MEFTLFEALDTAPAEYEIVKQDPKNFIYEFKDARDHVYKLWIYKKPTAGKNVWVALLSEKAAQAKAYKRVIGKFQDPKLVLSTIVAILKEIRENHKNIVKGILFEIPEKAFGSMSSKIGNILRMALRQQFDVPVIEYSDEETEKLGLKAIVMVSKPNKFNSVFILGKEQESQTASIIDTVQASSDIPDVEAAEVKTISHVSTIAKTKIEPVTKSEPVKTVVKQNVQIDTAPPKTKHDTQIKVEPVIKQVIEPKVEPVIATVDKPAELEIVKPQIENDFKNVKDFLAKAEEFNEIPIDDNIFEFLKDIDSVGYQKNERAAFRNKSNDIEVVFLVRNKGNTVNSVFDGREVSRILTNPKLKVLADKFKLKFVKRYTGTLLSSLSIDEFKLISNTQEVKDALLVLQSIDSWSNKLEETPLSKFFRSNYREVAHLTDESGNFNFSYVSYRGIKCNVTSKFDGDQLIISAVGDSIDASTKELGAVSKLSRSITKNEESGFEFTVSGSYYDSEYITATLLTLGNGVKSTVKLENEYGFEFYLNTLYTEGAYVIYSVSPNKYKVVADNLKKYTYTSQSYNGKNAFVDYDINGENEDSKLEHLNNTIDRIIKSKTMFEHFNKNQSQPDNKKDLDQILAEVKQQADKPINYTKSQFNDIYKKFVVFTILRKYFGYRQDESYTFGDRFNNPLSTAELEILEKSKVQMFNILSRIDTVDGDNEAGKVGLKQFLTDLKEVKEINLIEEYTKLGVVTSGYSDLFKDIHKRESDFNYSAREIIEPSDIESLRESLSKIQVTKDHSIDTIYTACKSAHDHDTYIDARLKTSSYRVKSKVSVNSMDEIRPDLKSLNDLKKHITNYIANNDKVYESETSYFLQNEDGTRRQQRTRAKELIYEFLTHNKYNLSIEEFEEFTKFVQSLPQHDQTGFLSSDPEKFRNDFWMSWAGRGGTVAHSIAYQFLSDHGQNNIGKEFWNQDALVSDEHGFYLSANTYIKSHFDWMYEDCQKFYKEKLKKKYAGKTFKLYRGVGGSDLKRYTPGTIESWTSTISTAKTFAKVMSSGDKQFVLIAEVPVEGIIGSWEQLAGPGDFPREVDLKGKKEFMVLGGVLKDCEIKAFEVQYDISAAKEIATFESYITESEESEDEELTLYGTLEVVFADDKGFTNPDNDTTIVSGVVRTK